VRVVVGVSGGIAAYKAVLVVRALSELGHEVRVVPTAAALNFVGAATWEALSGHEVRTDVFEDVEQVRHVRLGRWADVVLVAPATADLLARAASGRADDLLTATLLTAHGPVLMVPAMHTEMWQHPATVANVATLRGRGVHVIEPASGRLTGEDSGPGRLPEPPEIVEAVLALDPTAEHPLAGRRVVVSAGGTREPLDPVRYLGNRSSGKQGYAIARAAARLGASVTLVAANTDLAAPAGVEVVPVGSALELRDAMLEAADAADVVVMTAAVADYRPVAVSDHKIKKSGDAAPLTVELVENPDILVELVERRSAPGRVIVGFAAETGDATASVLDHGRAKARRKGADLLAVNDVSGGGVFASDANAVTFLDAQGEVRGTATGSKDAVARELWQAVLAL